MFNFVVSASDHFSFSFAIRSFGLFEDVDEMLALCRTDQLIGVRSVEGPVTYCANSLARRVKDCYRLYECCHVEYQDPL